MPAPNLIKDPSQISYRIPDTFSSSHILSAHGTSGNAIWERIGVCPVRLDCHRNASGHDTIDSVIAAQRLVGLVGYLVWKAQGLNGPVS